jgi:hypothetical protein
LEIEDENDNDNDFEISEESEENIIINLNKLSKMISAFLPHRSTTGIIRVRLFSC